MVSGCHWLAILSPLTTELSPSEPKLEIVLQINHIRLKASYSSDLGYLGDQNWH